MNFNSCVIYLLLKKYLNNGLFIFFLSNNTATGTAINEVNQIIEPKKSKVLSVSILANPKAIAINDAIAIEIGTLKRKKCFVASIDCFLNGLNISPNQINPIINPILGFILRGLSLRM